MNRAHWRKLSENRAEDARILLDGGQWASAFYLSGYAVECGLKSCVLAFVEVNADIVFRDRKYSEKCWTHDIGSLIDLAGLKAVRDVDTTADPALGVNWGLVQGWNEGTRYEFRPEAEARRLYEALINVDHGVLPWIQLRW